MISWRATVRTTVFVFPQSLAVSAPVLAEVQDKISVVHLFSGVLCYSVLVQVPTSLCHSSVLLLLWSLVASVMCDLFIIVLSHTVSLLSSWIVVVFSHSASLRREYPSSMRTWWLPYRFCNSQSVSTKSQGFLGGLERLPSLLLSGFFLAKFWPLCEYSSPPHFLLLCVLWIRVFLPVVLCHCSGVVTVLGVLLCVCKCALAYLLNVLLYSAALVGLHACVVCWSSAVHPVYACWNVYQHGTHYYAMHFSLIMSKPREVLPWHVYRCLYTNTDIAPSHWYKALDFLPYYV